MTGKSLATTGRARRLFSTDDARWRAVLARDSRADGQFWYAVKTTGVYCRPDCPSRRPNRANVVFFGATRHAEKAGFRACKKCDPRGESVAGRELKAVIAACRMIERTDTACALEKLAEIASMSRSHFHQLFKETTGVTPKDYAKAQRSRRLREALRRKRSVTEAIHDVGFNSSGRFYAGATKMLGMTPFTYRSHGSGMTIRFAVGACSLGAILVAASPEGICAILLGDDPEPLVHSLQDQFSHATLVGNDPEFDHLVATVVGFIEAPEVGLALPLDIRGTAFQQRVWRALQRIPIGQTASYAALAKRIGAPNAVRAVANACAQNKIAVAIPCHRVIRTDGELSGYRWGVERKRKLLTREGIRR